MRLLKLEVTDRADTAKKYTAIAVGGALLGLTGLVVLFIGLSTWLAMAFGSASIPMAAGHTIVGFLVSAAGGLASIYAIRQLPDGSGLPGPLPGPLPGRPLREPDTGADGGRPRTDKH